ncbi:MAG: T9SS C-terminal target domain-containing protein [Ignavibacteriae bacterium]|nr:MAG: T9SS C-terminal target domain-containing protein [Ignavibacteriota bacterium]
MIRIDKLIISLVLGMNVLSVPAFSQEAADKLIFSTPHGFYTDSFTLNISNSTPGATIKFTRDGTDPFTSSTALSQTSPASFKIDPVDITGRDKAPGVVIQACAVKDGFLLTEKVTQTYLFLDKMGELSPDGLKPGPGWMDPTVGTQFTEQGICYGMDPDVIHDPRNQNKITGSLRYIPTISLVTDLKNLFDPDSGIYVNALLHGSEWERSASAELLNPDGTPGFQINAGLRIRGAYGRTGTNYKHAFRLFFRAEYGKDKLRYPLFGDEGITEFDNIDLRTSQNYSWAYNAGGDNNRYTELREVFSRDTQHDMNQPYTRSRYYHLYINGTYWGVYQTQERAEASFGKSYLGGVNTDYDVVKVDVTDSLYIPNYHIEVTDGSLDAYRELWNIASNGFFSDEPFYKVLGLNPDGSRNPAYPVLVDIDNLIDYMLCYIYVGDPDGPTAGGIPNNFYCMNNRNADRGFVFFRHDAEHSLMNLNLDVTGSTTIGQEFLHFNPRWLHQRLTSHPEYCLRFYDHVYKHFFGNGALTPQACRERLLKRKNQIEDAVIAESARWGDTYNTIPRTKDDQWQVEVDWILNEFFPTRSDIVLQQLRARNLYTSIEPPAFSLTSGKVSKGTSLTMTAPAGTVYYTLDGNDTHVSASLQKASRTMLISRNSPKRVLVPTINPIQNWKIDPRFNDSTWLLCNTSPGGIGYDLGSTYDSDISSDIQSQMYNKNATCLIRIPFQVTADLLKDINSLTLRIQYNDGIAVFMNKTMPVASRNISGSLSWNAHANAVHDGKFIESIDLLPYLSYLKEGQNLLAIQALNIAPDDSTFFISVELVAGNTLKSSGPISPSAIAYTGPMTIDRTTKVKARVYSNECWSAINEVTFWVPEGNEGLKITELHYHPLGEAGVDEKEFEFIELKNFGATPIDLGGMTFTQGITYTFPSGASIKSGGHLVLASNDSAFEARYHASPFGRYSGQLSNAGETLVLQTAAGDTVFTLTYSDQYPWPNSPDGSGYSLIRNPETMALDQNNPDSWCASQRLHGNPGFDDAVTVVDAGELEAPRKYMLHQNFPNPFNPSTTITFTIPEKSFVTLKIYDLLGREVSSVISEELAQGNYTRRWDGRGVASGIYFYRMHAGNFIETKKMMFIK